MPSWNELIRAILRWISAVLDDYHATRWTRGQETDNNEAAEKENSGNNKK